MNVISKATLALASLLLVVSCAVRAGMGAGAGGTAPPPGGETTGGGEGGEGGPSATPQCPNAANHCLENDDVFVAESDFQGNYVTVKAAKQTGQPGPTGEAAFMVLHDGANLTTKYFWRTRPATPAELKIGQMAVMLDMNDSGVYREPRNRDEAKQNWFLARIVSVDPLAQGHVVVSGGYKVAVNGIRLVEGDKSPTTAVSGAEDRWFIHPDHWFIADGPMPATGYVTAHLAVVVKPPSAQTGGEGQFIATGSGQVSWNKNAWHTRPATKEDLKLGVHLFILDLNESGVYRAPKSREEALSKNWFIAKVVDTAQLYKGVVEVSGGYKCAIDGVRVAIK